MTPVSAKWKSFVKNDALVLAILFGMLAVLSIVQISGIRQATDAAKEAEKAAGATRLIEECQTPGTQCFEYSKRQMEQERSERRAETFCLLDVLLSAPAPPRTAEQSAAGRTAYLACIEARSLPDPAPRLTTPTTEGD